jgi:hypothetical protein
MVSFLRKMYAETKSPAVLEAARMYRNLFPGSFMPASATRQTSVIDYKNFMGTVAHAPCGTNQPDVCPAQVNTLINGTCTRDTGEETANEKWEVPGFAKFEKGKLNDYLLRGKTGNAKITAGLQKNGQENQKEPVFMGVPNSAMPMRCGYTITNPLNYQGTDVGYAGGGEGGTGGAA